MLYDLGNICQHLVIFAAVSAASTAIAGYASRLYKLPYSTSKLSGKQHIQELLDGNPRRICDKLGVSKHIFRCLVSTLFAKCGSCDSKWITREEQVGIFLSTSMAWWIINLQHVESMLWLGPLVNHMVIN